MIIKEFAKFNKVQIVEFIDNLNIDKKGTPNVDETSFSYGTFNVLLEYNGDEKWISIPYDLFLDFIYTEIPGFQNYSKNIEDMIDVLVDAVSIGVDFGEWLQKYIDVHYTPEIFNELESLSPEEDFDNDVSGYELGDDDEDEFEEDEY